MKQSLINLAVGMVIGLSSINQAAAEVSTPINPFEGAVGYVNPDYVTEVSSFFKNNPDYQDKAAALGLLDNSPQKNWRIPTAIWLDSTAAINGQPPRSRALASYLDDALDKYNKGETDGKPVAIAVVIYNLPLRDCDAYSSNGLYGKDDLPKYESEYINAIRDVFRTFFNKPNSDKVRLALVIEPDSLPNMLTNIVKKSGQPTANCLAAFQGNIYSKGIGYALKQFGTIAKDYPNANIAMYLDIAHSGWMGWKDNANKIAHVYNNSSEVDKTTHLMGLGDGFNYVRGFITNTSNYTPLAETIPRAKPVKEDFTYLTYLPYVDPQTTNWIRPTQFYGWNLVYDETSYIAEILSIQQSDGQLNVQGDNRIMPPAGAAKYEGKHFLVDTSRNGWMTNATDYNGYEPNVANAPAHPYYRHDQRHHRGNWCNAQAIQPQAGYVYDNPQKLAIPTKTTSTGFGELPRAKPPVANPLYSEHNPSLPIDAFVWIKPPGESDGFFDPSQPVGSKDRGDQMCGALPFIPEGYPYNGNPNSGGGEHNDYQVTDSLQGDDGKPAPKAGHFFPTAFKNLIDASICINGKGYQYASKFCPASKNNF